MNKRKAVLILTSVLFVLIFSPLTTYAIDYGGIGGDPAYPRADTPQSESIFIRQISKSN